MIRTNGDQAVHSSFKAEVSIAFLRFGRMSDICVIDGQLASKGAQLK